MDAQAAKAIILQPGEGRELPMGVGADRLVFKVTGEESAGLLTFLEYYAEPGSPGTSLHVHDGHEEGFYVLEGVLDMQLGDEKLTARPGGWVFVPRGAVHAFWNSSPEPCRFVATFTPSGFEKFFAELAEILARGQTREATAVEELSRRHGIRTVGPSPAL